MSAPRANRSGSPILDCPTCRTPSAQIWRDGPALYLRCRVCAADVRWRPLFARRQELIIDAAALAECRRDRR